MSTAVPLPFVVGNPPQDEPFRTHCSRGNSLCETCLQWRAEDIAGLEEYRSRNVMALPIEYFRSHIPGGEWAKDQGAPELRRRTLLACSAADQQIHEVVAAQPNRVVVADAPRPYLSVGQRARRFAMVCAVALIAVVALLWAGVL